MCYPDLAAISEPSNDMVTRHKYNVTSNCVLLETSMDSMLIDRETSGNEEESDRK